MDFHCILEVSGMTRVLLSFSTYHSVCFSGSAALQRIPVGGSSRPVWLLAAHTHTHKYKPRGDEGIVQLRGNDAAVITLSRQLAQHQTHTSL